MLKRKEYKALFNSSLAALGYIRPQINKVMEREIGEIFEFNGVKLKCVECTNDYCKDCYFRDKGMQCVRQKCVYRSRKDSKTVKFIQI